MIKNTMKSLLVFCGLAFTLTSTTASAGVFVSQYDLRPVNSNVLPFFVGYNVTIERDLPLPYVSTFSVTYTPYYVCASAFNCPRIILPFPSKLLINGQGYNACNAYVYTAASTYGSDIQRTLISDNIAWGCAVPAVAPVSARIIRANGLVDNLVGVRTF